jgi:hypothetical protein
LTKNKSHDILLKVETNRTFKKKKKGIKIVGSSGVNMWFDFVEINKIKQV